MKERKLSRARMISPLLLTLVLTGCLTSPPANDVFVEPVMDFGSLTRVAILPFQNLTGIDNAPERVRDTFTGMLLATGAVYVVTPGEVAVAMSKVGRFTEDGPSSAQIRELSVLLGVDAVITGVLREYGSVRSGASSANVVSLSLQMLEAENSAVIWSASSTQGGVTMWNRLLGGGGEPMNTVTEKVVDELLEKLFP